MSTDNLPSIDFTKIGTFVNERDVELWKQQAVAKYSKVKYEQLRKEIEIIDKKISTCEEKINKAEKKIPITKALFERMTKSITLCFNVVDHLIQRRIDVEKQIAEIKQKYDNMIEKYTELYESEKESLGKDNSLYKEMIEHMIAMKKLKIQKLIVYQSVEDLKETAKLKEEINEKILYTNVIDFVKAVKYAQELNAVDKEFAEKKTLVHNLLKIYEGNRKADIGNQSIMGSKSLPKLSLQIRPEPEFLTFNFSTVLPRISPTKSKTAQTIDEENMLKKFQQRSDKRQKMIQQRQTSTLPLPKRLGTVNSGQVSTNINCENRGYVTATDNGLNKENTKPSSKIKLLQNEVLIPDKGIFKKDEKRKPKDGNSIIKKKKKVSFGECLPQEVPTEKTNHNPEQAAEISPFFTNLETPRGEDLDSFADSSTSTLFHRPIAQESTSAVSYNLASDTSDFAMNDLLTSKELDDDPFLSLKSVDNDTSFQWNQSTSQQKFNMF